MAFVPRRASPRMAPTYFPPSQWSRDSGMIFVARSPISGLLLYPSSPLIPRVILPTKGTGITSGIPSGGSLTPTSVPYNPAGTPATTNGYIVPSNGTYVSQPGVPLIYSQGPHDGQGIGVGPGMRPYTDFAQQTSVRDTGDDFIPRASPPPYLDPNTLVIPRIANPETPVLDTEVVNARDTFGDTAVSTESGVDLARSNTSKSHNWNSTDPLLKKVSNFSPSSPDAPGPSEGATPEPTDLLDVSENHEVSVPEYNLPPRVRPKVPNWTSKDSSRGASSRRGNSAAPTLTRASEDKSTLKDESATEIQARSSASKLSPTRLQIPEYVLQTVRVNGETPDKSIERPEVPSSGTFSKESASASGSDGAKGRTAVRPTGSINSPPTASRELLDPAKIPKIPFKRRVPAKVLTDQIVNSKANSEEEKSVSATAVLSSSMRSIEVEASSTSQTVHKPKLTLETKKPSTGLSSNSREGSKNVNAASTVLPSEILSVNGSPVSTRIVPLPSPSKTSKHSHTRTNTVTDVEHSDPNTTSSTPLAPTATLSPSFVTVASTVLPTTSPSRVTTPSMRPSEPITSLQVRKNTSKTAKSSSSKSSKMFVPATLLPKSSNTEEHGTISDTGTESVIPSFVPSSVLSSSFSEMDATAVSTSIPSPSLSSLRPTEPQGDSPKPTRTLHRAGTVKSNSTNLQTPAKHDKTATHSSIQSADSISTLSSIEFANTLAFSRSPTNASSVESTLTTVTSSPVIRDMKSVSSTFASRKENGTLSTTSYSDSKLDPALATPSAMQSPSKASSPPSGMLKSSVIKSSMHSTLTSAPSTTKFTVPLSALASRTKKAQQGTSSPAVGLETSDTSPSDAVQLTSTVSSQHSVSLQSSVTPSLSSKVVPRARLSISSSPPESPRTNIPVASPTVVDNMSKVSKSASLAPSLMSSTPISSSPSSRLSDASDVIPSVLTPVPHPKEPSTSISPSRTEPTKLSPATKVVPQQSSRSTGQNGTRANSTRRPRPSHTTSVPTTVVHTDVPTTEFPMEHANATTGATTQVSVLQSKNRATEQMTTVATDVPIVGETQPTTKSSMEQANATADATTQVSVLQSKSTATEQMTTVTTDVPIAGETQPTTKLSMEHANATTGATTQVSVLQSRNTTTEHMDIVTTDVPIVGETQATLPDDDVSETQTGQDTSRAYPVPVNDTGVSPALSQGNEPSATSPSPETDDNSPPSHLLVSRSMPLWPFLAPLLLLLFLPPAVWFLLRPVRVRPPRPRWVV
ncbi:mucin-2-like [Ornithodoros turicata]|uniref:mucin-2-like n=1 Tax=Ornithodoros turicata TaxID=34597 RepID=UPI003138ADDA